MIGLLMLKQPGVVANALERSEHALLELHGIDEALRELERGSLDALIVERGCMDDGVRAVLCAARARDTPALVIARDRSARTAVEALRAGATDYLVAPFEYGSLVAAVDRLIDAAASEQTFPIDADTCLTEDREANDTFLTRDPEVKGTLELIRSVAASDATVLIEGESGTGKELLARLVHRASTRRSRELISINCAALPAGLLESELFGHERGAFTGAHSRVIGKFELAHGTTILLDEIGELELSLQAKLLRVIQEKEVQRVGGRRPVRVDFRLVVTTNRDLAAQVEAGRFREDLYFRLNVVPVRIKPLRERPGDVALLVEHLLQRHARAGRKVPRLRSDTIGWLERQDWPGNVRELENLIERLVLTRGGSTIQPRDLGLPVQRHCDSPPAPDESRPFRTLREMERWLIVDTLKRLQGNRTRAARELAISLRTLRNKIHEYEIVEPETLPRTGAGAGRRRARPAAQISPTPA